MDVAVVGAGVSGLTCAFRLMQAGNQVTVYERERQVGGRMSTVEAGGFHVDVGTNLLLDNYDRLKALCLELGIGKEFFPFVASEGGVLRDGRLTSFDPASLGDILRYRGLSRLARLRVLAYLLRSWPSRHDLDFFDLSEGEDRLDTVDAYTGTVARCGREVAEYLVDPFVRTFHFHSARAMSMKYFDALAALFMARGGFVAHGFRGYMSALPRALAARLTVKRARPVDAVRPTENGVEVVRGGTVTLHDAVVLALPAPGAHAVLADPTPGQERILSTTRYSSTLVCSYRCPLSVAGDFEGIWVPYRESRIICDCANEGCKGSRDAQDCVLTMCVHGEATRDLRGQSDGDVLRVVEAEWVRLFSAYRGHLTGIHVHRWAHALPIYGVGQVTQVKRFWAEGQGQNRVWLCGDYLNQPWVEGSIRCGEKVARAIG